MLGRVGFDPQSVLAMTEAELMSHITNILPPPSRNADDGAKTYVNEARLRRKNKQSEQTNLNK